MKKMKSTFLFAVLLVGCIACKQQTGNTQVISTEAKSDSLKQACGVVIDATMNGFTIVTCANDTVWISTMDKDVTVEGGLLLGDTLDVTYTISPDNPMVNIVSTLKKVTGKK